MLPSNIEVLGVKAYTSLREALDGADVVMALRIQMERLEGACFPSVREYAATFGIDRAKLRYAKDDAIVMHPGPVNRGVELSHDLADHRPSVILDQVRNGVALRMALLYLLSGRSIQRDARLAGSGDVRPARSEEARSAGSGAAPPATTEPPDGAGKRQE
jgi:aspartate carbamoyltransferase catalytic subunit